MIRAAALAGMFVALLSCGERGRQTASSVRSPFFTADSLRDEGRFLKAHPLYRQLRDSFALVRDTANLWPAQLWWAYTLTRNNRTDSAGVALQAAMHLAGDDPGRQGWTRWVRCARFSRMGQSDSAIAECSSALELAATSGNHELQGRIHHQLGTIHSRLGHYRIAVKEAERTLAIQRQHHHSPQLLIGTFNSIGIEYSAVGRLSEAERMYQEGLQMADSLNSVWNRAILKSNLAYLRQSTGNLPDALRLMTESLHEAGQLPDTQSMVYAHNSLAEFYLSAGNRSRAREHLQESNSMNQRVSAIFRVIAMLDLGLLETADSNLQLAEPALKTAMALADTAGFGLQRAVSRGALSRLAVKRGNATAALRWADAAVAIADSLDAPDAQIDALEARAAALEAARRSDASDSYLKGIDLLESWRGRLALGDLRMGVAEPRWAIYEGAIRTLLDQGRKAEALMVAERARARLLLEVMADRDASRPAASPLEGIRQRLRVRFEERAAVSRPDEQVSLDHELQQLTDSLARLEALESGRYPAPATIKTLQANLLAPGRALLHFFWGDRDVYGWWVTRDTIHATRLGNTDSLAALVEFLRGSIERPASDSGWMAPALGAFGRLIAPLEPGPATEILVVADGPLSHIPIEVLIPERGELPWGATTRFVHGPSATVLLTLLKAPRSPGWNRTMLALGNSSARTAGSSAGVERGPGAGDTPPPLTYADPEARAIRDLFRAEGADLLVGNRATARKWLELDPARYRYLHFAAHARVSDRRPEETYLVLNESTLDLAAIRRLRLHADLVTLSACETALGRRVRGEGVIGLSHAFLAAGARATLVTLWRIADRSASDFMQAFYRELHAGVPPAQALLVVRRRWVVAGGAQGHPSHWAPFVLVGGGSE
jgi:tetratricopeptide (TPR) repeat protein